MRAPDGGSEVSTATSAAFRTDARTVPRVESRQMQAKIYPEAFRLECVARLIANGGRIRETAAELGIPSSTLLNWRDEADQGSRADLSVRDKMHAERYLQASLRGAELMIDELEAALDKERGSIPARDLRDYAIVAGIASDKALDFRDGRKGTQINVDARSLTLPPGLTADELRAIAFAPQPTLEAPSDSTT